MKLLILSVLIAWSVTAHAQSVWTNVSLCRTAPAPDTNLVVNIPSNTTAEFFGSQGSGGLAYANVKRLDSGDEYGITFPEYYNSPRRLIILGPFWAIRPR